jgi:hypothetical protein
MMQNIPSSRIHGMIVEGMDRESWLDSKAREDTKLPTSKTLKKDLQKYQDQLWLTMSKTFKKNLQQYQEYIYRCR